MRTTPARTRPIKMTTTPPTRDSRTRLVSSTALIADAPAPSAVKTAPKPVTKSRALDRARLRAARRSTIVSATLDPAARSRPGLSWVVLLM